MSDAAWLSEPLLGTATRSATAPLSGFTVVMVASEVRVDVVGRDARREHEHLRVVQQLADLLGRTRGRLVLGGHPGLGRLLDELLSDRMDAGVQGSDGARPLGSGACLVA